METGCDFPLHWVGGFVRSIKPYVFVRRADSLLILMPNQAYRLNGTALDLLEHLLDGGPLERFLSRWGGSPAVRRDLYHFFCDLRALVSGCLGDGEGRKAVEQVPFEVPFSSLPVLSELALTYRCNLRCRFCYAGCGCRSREESRELTTAEAERVLRIVRRRAQVPSISFTGGEPALRGDLARLTETAVKVGLRVNLITNGTLITQEIACRLAGAGLTSAQVSVEGPDPECHDGLTGVPGSFNDTWRGIDALREAGIATQTNTTINGVNKNKVLELVELLAERGMSRFAMNMLVPCGSAGLHPELEITYSEIGGIVTSVQDRARELGLQFLWYSPTPYCLFNPIANGHGNKGCAACDGLLSISPTGEILPCSSFDYGVGNLLAGDFEDLWNSARAVFWRRKQYAPPQCSGCPTFVPCAGACPIYWQAFGTAELDGVLKEEAV
jgi:radical SAM protein with 4Fe4S-binding SPASM domain